ncbi:hypothetical protein HDU67_001702 [Dinochytrium kinnereticum]|nr:hypothetical protein HDU67_001702 [Dinochytrium kinnereticum]
MPNILFTNPEISTTPSPQHELLRVELLSFVNAQPVEDPLRRTPPMNVCILANSDVPADLHGFYEAPADYFCAAIPLQACCRNVPGFVPLQQPVVSTCTSAAAARTSTQPLPLPPQRPASAPLLDIGDPVIVECQFDNSLGYVSNITTQQEGAFPVACVAPYGTNESDQRTTLGGESVNFPVANNGTGGADPSRSSFTIRQRHSGMFGPPPGFRETMYTDARPEMGTVVGFRGGEGTLNASVGHRVCRIH